MRAHTLQGNVHRRFNDPREPRSALLAGTIGEDSAGLAPARPCNGLVIVGLECQAFPRDLSFLSRFSSGAVSEQSGQSGGGRSGAKSPARLRLSPCHRPKRRGKKENSGNSTTCTPACSCQSNRSNRIKEPWH